MSDLRTSIKENRLGVKLFSKRILKRKKDNWRITTWIWAKEERKQVNFSTVLDHMK